MTTPFAAIAIAGLLSSTPTNTVSIHLIRRCPETAKCLSATVVERMKAEPSRIWSSLDVEIEWIDSVETARGVIDLKVLLEETYEPRLLRRIPNDFLLAVLHPPEVPCGPALARVWVTEVQRYAGAARRQAFPLAALPETLPDLFLARALGRALAHEIGHYLLPTRGHTVRGLMRARFALHELMEGPTRTRYGLDQRDREALSSCRSKRSLAGDSTQ
jgi:hypothetical protein